MSQLRAACAGLAVALLAQVAAAETTPGAELPASPFRVVHATRRSPEYLDATPVCLPRELAGAEGVATRLRDGDIVGVHRALAKLDGEASRAGRTQGSASDLELIHTVVDARIASGSQRAALRVALRRLAERATSPSARGCALLESARLALLIGLPLDARVDRVRARHQFEGGQFSGAQAPTAAWLEAEELHRTGDDSRARALWADVEAAGDARLALAARLRLVEARFPVADSAAPQAGAVEEWAGFPKLLQEASALRLDVEPWSLVAGELAIRAGDLQAAHYWLARAELAWPGGLASIRKADVLAALDRTGDARNTLDRVARAARDPAVREIAELRIAALELVAGERAAAVARIAGPARSLHPEVRAEALLLRAADQVASGQAASALDSYARLARAGGRTDEDPRFREGLARAARDFTSARVGCPLILQKLGSRTALLARYLPDSGPLLRVGDCFLTLNMPGAALDTYRAVQNRFGQETDLMLPLRIATAALAAGDTESTHKAVDTALSSSAAQDGGLADLRWRWLAFALAEREGRTLKASAYLEQLARAEDLPSELRPEVELAILRWMDAAGNPSQARAALRASVAFEPAMKNDARGFAWIRLADLAMADPDPVSAAGAYSTAASMLAPGPLRDRARHHAALLAGTRQARTDALAAAADPGSASEWARVAGLERRLQKLADEVDGEQARLP